VSSTSEKLSLSYDKKNAINLVLGSFWAAISGTLTILANMMRQEKIIPGSYLILFGMELVGYAAFIGIRWYYYNSRTVGHLPMFSEDEINNLVQTKIQDGLAQSEVLLSKKEANIEQRFEKIINALEQTLVSVQIPKEVEHNSEEKSIF